ncbi:Unknown protein sequence [Pseudomonas amygdali pv. ciccaronei]|nr:Unknown protein sequence [Pseudomonas amygdali pv. ciccaronei]
MLRRHTKRMIFMNHNIRVLTTTEQQAVSAVITFTSSGGAIHAPK